MIADILIESNATTVRYCWTCFAKARPPLTGENECVGPAISLPRSDDYAPTIPQPPPHTRSEAFAARRTNLRNDHTGGFRQARYPARAGCEPPIRWPGRR